MRQSSIAGERSYHNDPIFGEQVDGSGSRTPTVRRKRKACLSALAQAGSARKPHNRCGLGGCVVLIEQLTRAHESEIGAMLMPTCSNKETDMASGNVKSEAVARAIRALVDTSSESKFVVGWGQDQNRIAYDKEAYRCGCGCGKK